MHIGWIIMVQKVLPSKVQTVKASQLYAKKSVYDEYSSYCQALVQVRVPVGIKDLVLTQK